MADETVWLQRTGDHEPWGFRLYGGRDFHCPLSVQKVTAGSIASTGLAAGDVILRIGDTDTGLLSHAQAMMAIKHAGNMLQLIVARAGAALVPAVVDSSNTPSMFAPQPPSSVPQVPQVHRQELWDFGGQDNGVEALGGSGGSNHHDTSVPPADLRDVYADFDSLSESMATARRLPTNSEASASVVPPMSTPDGGVRSGYPSNLSDGCDGSYGRGNRSNDDDLNGHRQFDDRPLGVAGYDGGFGDCFSVSRGDDRVSTDWGAADGAGGDGYDAVYGSGVGQSGGLPTSRLDVYEGNDDELARRSDVWPSRDVTGAGGYGSVDAASGVFQDNFWNVDGHKPLDEGFWRRQNDDGEQMRLAWDSIPPAPPPTATDCPVSFLDYESRPPPVAPPLPPPGPPPTLMTSSSAAAMSKDFTAMSRFDSSKTPPTGGVHRSVSNDNSPYTYGSSAGSPYQATAGYPFGGEPISTGGGYFNGNHDMSASYSASEPDFYSNGLGNDESGYYGTSQNADPATSGYASATSPPIKAQPVVPDAILNMAAKGPQDKKPFAYVADVNDIREHRDRVRKRTPASTLPRYQHMLNMPQFEEPTPRRVRSTPPPPDRGTEPVSDTAVVANLQFNTPLGLYSGDNVVEALKGQTGGQIAGVVGLPKKEKGDFTQSAVYKMIHGIDQPKPKPAIVYAEAKDQSTPPRQPSVEDETRFSGLNNRATDIPSKSFHRLQSWTGTTGNTGGSEIDTTSIRRNVHGGSAEGGLEDGPYDEKSIRYTGRNIPSRSFRMLQQMTGGNDDSSSPVRELAADQHVRPIGLRSRSETPKRMLHPQQQQQQSQYQQQQQQPSAGHQQQQQPHVNVGGSEIDTSSFRHNLLPADNGNQDVGEYDQTSIRYTGKNIPSKSFRMLQHLTGNDPGTPPVQHSPRTGRSQQPHQQPQRRYRTPSDQDTSRDLQQQQQQPADDAAPKKDIRYVGGSIPSQSFRMLQQSIGPDSNASANQTQQPVAGTHDGAGVNGVDMLQSASLGRKVKVVRLRSQASTEDTGATEF